MAQEQELVSLVTTNATAHPVTPELGLVLEELMMTPTRVGTKPCGEIMATNTLKPWDTS